VLFSDSLEVKLAHKKLGAIMLGAFYKDSKLLKISASMFNNRFQEIPAKRAIFPLSYPNLKELDLPGTG
jgi:hypothetical protein